MTDLHQRREHVRQLLTALIAYVDATNLCVSIEPRLLDALRLDHVASCTENRPGLALTLDDINKATEALHQLMQLCTFNAWPAVLKEPCLSQLELPPR